MKQNFKDNRRGGELRNDLKLEMLKSLNVKNVTLGSVYTLQAHSQPGQGL